MTRKTIKNILLNVDFSDETSRKRKNYFELSHRSQIDLKEKFLDSLFENKQMIQLLSDHGIYINSIVFLKANKILKPEEIRAQCSIHIDKNDCVRE